MATSKVRIGLMGFGTIGQGTYRVIEMNHDTILRNTGLDLIVTKILVRDSKKSKEMGGVSFRRNKT